MAYTAIDDPSAFFQTTIWTGDASARSITFDGNSDMQPDWVWIKNRASTQNHRTFDSVRGAGKNLVTNNTGAEIDAGTGTDGQLRSFASDGFTIGTDGSVNNNNEGIVAWSWKTGTAFSNDASSTSVGSIDTAGSVNTTAGFSIIGWTGTAENATLAHGLGVVPQWIIVKNRGAATSWRVYHHKNTAAPETDHLKLDTTDATADDDSMWNDTAPTSSVFSLKTSSSVNSDGVNYIAYCFAEKQGYSKFGKWIGNGNNDGPFSYTGFKPAFIMIKRTDVAKNWYINDNLRLGYNVNNPYLSPNLTAAETGGTEIDILSNGFKIRASGTGHNQNNGTYLYMAFAENPFVTSTGVPGTAR